jgi:hypothetical protein
MANSQFGIAGPALCGALAIAAFLAGDAKQRLLLARSVVVLSAFTVFQSLLLLRQANSVSNVLSGTFYYGALFSVFSLIVVTISIGTLMGRKWALLPIVAASAYMAIVSGTSFHDFNARWIAIHNDIYAEQIGDSFGRLDKDAALTWARIERYWSARGDASRLHAMRGVHARTHGCSSRSNDHRRASEAALDREISTAPLQPSARNADRRDCRLVGPALGLSRGAHLSRRLET